MAIKGETVQKNGSPLIGNAFAYFLIIYAIHRGWLEEKDAKEALAFGGAIIIWIGLYLNSIGRGIVNFVKWCVTLFDKKE